MKNDLNRYESCDVSLYSLSDDVWRSACGRPRRDLGGSVEPFSEEEQLHETQSLVDVGRLVEAAPEETVKLFQETKRKSIRVDFMGSSVAFNLNERKLSCSILIE